MAHPPLPHAPAWSASANADARAVDAWFASVSLKEIAPQDIPLVTVEASDSVEVALKARHSLISSKKKERLSSSLEHAWILLLCFSITSLAEPFAFS